MLLKKKRKLSKKNQKNKERKRKEKRDTENNIYKAKKDLFTTIIKLQRISKKLNEIAMNNNHIKNEEDYINDLIQKLGDIDLNENEKIEKMKKIKKNYQLYKKALKLEQNVLLNLDDSQLTKILNSVEI